MISHGISSTTRIQKVRDTYIRTYIIDLGRSSQTHGIVVESASSPVCFVPSLQMRFAHIAIKNSSGLLTPYKAGITSRNSFRRASTAPRAVLEEAVTVPDSRQEHKAPPSGAEDSAPLPKPGDADRQRFRLHWSVDMWQDFNPRNWIDRVNADPSAPLPARLGNFLETFSSALSSSGALRSPQAAAYWAYHTSRSGFFAVQAILGLAAARAAAGNTVRPEGALTRFERIARDGWQGPLTEAFLSYYQDYENIKEGRYGLPWDMTTLTHRQFNPLYILRKGAAFLSEARETMRRREQGTAEDVWLRSAFLPGYFQSTFHYQTDGWLSDKSAKVYESSTETLFIGRQDAMQRSTLVPLADFMPGKDPSQLRALEVAAGTGRFATFVKDTYPALDLTVTDLSPFYLQEARSNLRYWKAQRAPDAMLAGVDGNGVSFLQAAAENLPFEDESFDVVYSVYLFHELPGDVRKKAIQEMARVLAPGGMLVLTDSVQLGDRAAFDATLGGFGDFNEPYYRDYLGVDLGELFENEGLTPDLKVVCSTTKSLSFRKPAREETSNRGGVSVYRRTTESDEQTGAES